MKLMKLLFATRNFSLVTGLVSIYLVELFSAFAGLCRGDLGRAGYSNSFIAHAVVLTEKYLIGFIIEQDEIPALLKIFIDNTIGNKRW